MHFVTMIHNDDDRQSLFCFLLFFKLISASNQKPLDLELRYEQQEDVAPKCVWVQKIN